mmetsp:Transcript_41990/g.48323  ORF Transcript_41990/g.48323 Transcript_41990/m.48323 type:complete len:106 (+) Transcript_41990:1122-1439(+)
MPFVPNLAILPIDFPCEENSTQKSTMSGPKEDCPLHDEQTNSNVGLLKKFQHFVEMQTTYRWVELLDFKRLDHVDRDKSVSQCVSDISILQKSCEWDFPSLETRV